METPDPLLLQVLEQLKSIREDNSRFADDVNRGFHSVHARLDAIEQDRDGRGSRYYQGSHTQQSLNPGPLSDQLIYDDGDPSSSRVLPYSSRPGLRVVPERLAGDLTDHQTSQLISNLCDEAYYEYGPGPVAESSVTDNLVKVKKGKFASFNIGSRRKRQPMPRAQLTRGRSFFQRILGAEEMFENDPAIKAGLVDENGVEIDRSDGYHTREMALRRNPCMQFVHDIGNMPIHPNSTLRTRWDLMILMLLVYVCITAPVMVCFEITLDQWGALWWWENIVNGIFVMDIFLNMNTAYYDAEDNLVTKRSLIFLQYFYSWMIVDVIAVLPYEYMTDGGNSSNADEAATLAKGLKLTKFTRILRVLRVIKLLRVLKVPALLKRFEGASGYGLVKFLTILGGAILMNHLVACVFYYCAHLRMGDDLEFLLNTTDVTYGHFVMVMANDSSVEGFVYDAEEFESMTKIQHDAWKQTWVYNAGLEDDTPVERYITALYWGMSTLTTVGYGDVTPMNSTEKICSMLAMVIGVTVFAYFMGTTAALITSMNSNDSVKTRKIGEMDTFLRARHVPPSMTDKIRKFYSKAVQHHLIDNQDMVSQLSMPLRTELLLFLYRNTLEKVPFFKGKDPQFITALVAKLRMEYYAEGDIVIHEGDLGNVMYFVVKGNLEARQYIWEPDAEPQEDIELSGPRDEETGKHETFEKIKAKLLRRRTSKAEIEAFMDKRPREFGFYSNVRELKKKFRLVGELRDGEHFGEYSCLLGQHRTSTIVSLDFSELYSLSRDDLMEVYKMWPELHKEFLHLMKQFQEMTGMELTDEEFEQNYGASRPEHRFSMDGPPPGSAVRQQPLPPLQEDEPSLPGPQIDANTPSVTEGSSSTGGADYGRERDQVSMKKAVQLIMNTKKFDKLASNPVFQLLSEGQDLRGMREKTSVSDRGESSGSRMIGETASSASAKRISADFWGATPTLSSAPGK